VAGTGVEVGGTEVFADGEAETALGGAGVDPVVDAAGALALGGMLVDVDGSVELAGTEEVGGTGWFELGWGGCGP